VTVMAGSGLLQLGPPVTFEPASCVNSVFYDEACGQVFSVRGGAGVVVKGVAPHSPVVTARLEAGQETEPVRSIKLSPDQRTLTTQRTANTLEFLSLGGEESSSWSLPVRAKDAALLGFAWLSNNELVLVTDTGLELFSLGSDRRAGRFLRSVSEPCAWFCHAGGPHLVTAGGLERAGEPGLAVWLARSGNITRLGRVSLPGPARPDRDVSLVEVRGERLVQATVRGEHGGVEEVLLYSLTGDRLTLTHRLADLHCAGPLGVHAVDGLLVLHCQVESQSVLYDLRLEVEGEAGQGGAVVRPALPPTHLPSTPYSPHWVLFPPATLLDARAGNVCSVGLQLASLGKPAQDPAPAPAPQLVRFLLQRKAGKASLLALLRFSLLSLPLPTLAELGDLLCAAHQAHTKQAAPAPVVVDQAELYTSVLLPASEDCPGRTLPVLLELLASLHRHSIAPRQFLHELLINLHVKTGRLYQLHQLSQYAVLADSKPAACLLLSLETLYPPARQLALDMMHRLGTAQQEITEILLASGKVVTAINHVAANGGLETAPARKFLQAAEDTGDRMVFFNVFSCFEERNTRLRGSPAFTPTDQCESYVKKFKEMFLNNNVSSEK